MEQWVAANPSNPDEPVIAHDIASQPQATWFTTYNPTTIESQVSSLASAAAAAGEVPILVAYDIPNRDCGGASAGGAPTIADYETWIANFAAGLGRTTAIVLVEPDSLAPGTFVPSLAYAMATYPDYAAQAPSCSVTYAIQSSWTGGYTANVTLTNTGTDPFGGWTVTYPGDEQVTNLWNAYYTKTGETVAAHDRFDTSVTVDRGHSVSYGMQGTYTSSDAVPTSFTLTANNGQTVNCTNG